MHSDQISNHTSSRYRKFYAYLENPQKEPVKKDVKKTNSVKLKDLLYPS